MTTPLKLAIVGGGRAAWAFGSTWRRIGWPIAGIATRNEHAPIAKLLDVPRRRIEEMLDADLILIAVSDRAIHEVAARVPKTDAIVWHPSGSVTSVRGGFSLHPLRALPPVGEPSDLAGTLLVFEGTHREVAKRIADAAASRFAEITAEEKPRYHAAAVFASNYVAALLDIANELIGIDHARDDLVALAQSAIENWGTHAGPQRFTGPAARGDSEVIAAHIEMLQPQEDLAVIYRLLADRILASAK